MDISKDDFKNLFLEKVTTMHGKTFEETSGREQYKALCAVVRDMLAQKWIASNQRFRQEGQKQVYYLSIEYLLGRLLGINLLNLGVHDVCAEALSELGIRLDELEELEEDPGIGNGGLGRLAACYLESMAAERLPGNGCCIRYRFGFFEQRMVNGYQKEVPDDWLSEGFPWEFRRSDEAAVVKFGGQVRAVTNGKLHYIHENYDAVAAVPYDVPVPGFENDTVNTLRLWGAEPIRENFVCNAFDRNDCLRAADYKYDIQKITSVLYPDDSAHDGRILRLKQQYFLVSASLQSIVNEYKKKSLSIFNLAEHVAIHINDTHPALAVPELMRILIDEEGLGWDEAWQITVNTLSYTNHTVLPEALEKWPVDILQPLLPRMYVIINEINERFCRELWERYPGNWDKIRMMAIIGDGNVRMAHLAIVGSHSINGVAQLHTEILKTKVMDDFYQVYPRRFNNVTNGVAHRRWLLKANPELANLIYEAIGPSWINYPCDMLRLLKYDDDRGFQEKLAIVKHSNKLQLAKHIKDMYGISVDVESIFDSHIKRIHGYKRQTMNAFHIMHLYNLLRDNPSLDIIPRTFIFGGKAAPGYQQAKRTIKLINTLASVINADKSIRDKIKVVFLENYNVSSAELIIPGSDVSEQIPTASREACGTGNMKFMMNGAITIGTMDGANVEIYNAIGDENIIVFGLTAEEVLEYYSKGGYNAWDVYHSDLRIKTVLDQLINGFLPVHADEFKPLYDSFLYHNDEYFVLKDFAAYVDAQKRLEQRYRSKQDWLSMCIHNIAHSGKFSGDRTFTEYAMDIWKMGHEHRGTCYCPHDEAFSKRQEGCVHTVAQEAVIHGGQVLEAGV